MPKVLKALPVAISFIGRVWSESTLIKLAYAFELASKHLNAPGLLNLIDQNF